MLPSRRAQQPSTIFPNMLVTVIPTIPRWTGRLTIPHLPTLRRYNNKRYWLRERQGRGVRVEILRQLYQITKNFTNVLRISWENDGFFHWLCKSNRHQLSSFRWRCFRVTVNLIQLSHISRRLFCAFHPNTFSALWDAVTNLSKSPYLLGPNLWLIFSPRSS